MKLWSGIALLSVLAGSALVTNESFAASACLCTLQWQASPDSSVTGYALYYSVAGSATTNRLDMGQATNATLANLNVSSTYYFYAVAYDSSQNESNPSNLLPYTAVAIS